MRARAALQRPWVPALDLWLPRSGTLGRTESYTEMIAALRMASNYIRNHSDNSVDPGYASSYAASRGAGKRDREKVMRTSLALGT